MKQKILALGLCILALGAKAQDCKIALTPIVTESSEVQQFPQVSDYLVNKLRAIVANGDNLSGLNNNQFAITVTYNVQDKQIVKGAPNKVVYNIIATLNIVDLKGQKVFSTYAEELKGAGNNETKALISTFQKVKATNPRIINFVSAGEKKIISYYNDNYSNIISSAQALAAMKNFDGAIYNLMMIPECCNGYDQVLNELKVVYQQFVNQHCNENLAQARAAWIVSPNSEGAATASVYLSEIYPDAACYSEALKLAAEIKKQMGEEWKFAMRQWSDSISLERQRINAMRDISIAYANAHPQNENTYIFWR